MRLELYNCKVVGLQEEGERAFPPSQNRDLAQQLASFSITVILCLISQTQSTLGSSSLIFLLPGLIPSCRNAKRCQLQTKGFGTSVLN